MNKKVITVIAIVLACILLISALAVTLSLNHNADDDNNNGYVPTDDPYEKDDLPALDYGGEPVTILYWNDGEHDEFDITETSDDMLKNSIYNRNRTVEQRLGITFEYVGTPGFETASFEKKLYDDIFSGACDYDLVASFSMTVASCATSNLCCDLLEYDYLNFDKPWWPKSLTDQATINRKLYFAAGDISTSTLYEMYMVFYNIDMFDEYRIGEDPVSLALDGKWTWEKLYEYASIVGYEERNGDNIRSDGDRFGFILEDATIDPIFFSAGLRMFSHDNSGGISVDESCFSSNAAEFIDRFNRFLHTSGDAYFRPKSTDLSARTTGQMFSRGEALMTVGRACWARDIFATVENLNYGILPVPKANEDQDYVSALYARDTFYAISAGTPIDEIAAATMECMASESYRRVTPVLFETIMKLRYSPTAASSQIYDIVRASISFDLSRVFHRALNSRPLYVFRDAVKDNTPWGSNATNTTKQLNKLIEEYIMSAFEK